MMADIQLHFGGVLDRDLFESALDAALARNPLFRCIVGRDPTAGPGLAADRRRCPSIDWAPLGDAAGRALRRHRRSERRKSDCGFGSARERTARRSCCTFIMPAPTRWEPLPSSKIFWQPMPRSARADRRSRGARLIPSRLRRRGLASIPPRNWYQQIFDLFIGAREALRFFLQAPTPLAGGGIAPPANVAGGNAAPPTGPKCLLGRWGRS